jgi:hypothetical protein
MAANLTNKRNRRCEGWSSLEWLLEACVVVCHRIGAWLGYDTMIDEVCGHKKGLIPIF